MSEEISTYQGARLIQITGNKVEWVNDGETFLFDNFVIIYFEIGNRLTQTR